MPEAEREQGTHQVERWEPGKKQGHLAFDLQGWSAEPKRRGSTRLLDEVSSYIRSILDQKLADDRRAILQARGIRWLVYVFGARQRNYGTSLAQELSETLEKTWQLLEADAMACGGGVKVRRPLVLIRCCLVPSEETAQEILARLDDLEDYGEGNYVNFKLTKKPVPEKRPKQEPERIEREREQRAPRLQLLAQQLQGEMTSRLKGLIPTLSSTPEEKAQEVLALSHRLNQVFWEELRGELLPTIKPLLQDIPSDYEGKRTRAALVNGLLSAFNLAILIRDDHGRPRHCSVYAVRARISDERGNLRLLERTASGSSRRSYPIPAPDKLELIESPRQEPEAAHQQSHSGRGH